MPYNVKINSCLRLSPAQGLPDSIKEGQEFKFTKDSHRVYPIDIPMNLFSDKWEALARIAILRTTVGDGKTTGTFRILMVYTPEQSNAISSTIIPYKQFNKKE
jgi:hypothetical protein